MEETLKKNSSLKKEFESLLAKDLSKDTNDETEAFNFRIGTSF